MGVKRLLVVLGLAAAGYLVVRGVTELFVIDLGDPASYRSDWGGPSLIGVLAVHSGPALLVLAGAVIWLRRRRRQARRRHRAPGAPADSSRRPT
jgi:uncharacterized iron-regulated membrane protein